MGSKIKTFAKVLMIIGVIACVICFFVGNSQYNKDKNYIEYATVNGGSSYSYLQSAGDSAYAGLMLKNYGLYGTIGVIFGGLPLYWFGCLFERVEEIQYTANESKRQLEELKRKIEG